MLFSLLMNGCSSVYFVFQAAQGQLKLLNRGRPIEEVINDPKTDPKLAELLKLIPEFKKFGEDSGLKATPNYREYVKLDQDAVSYVVTISSALKFEPKIFSFPIVGSFNYLGWFKRDDAVEFASKYEKEGYDIDVRGAGAYSTLGWFRDPLLSSMISSDEKGIDASALPELLNVVVHESVHATLYIKDQSTFNENIASFIADKLTDQYIETHGLIKSEGWLSYLSHIERGKKIRERMAQAYRELSAIYGSGDSDESKLQKKTAYLNALQTELKFRRKISNATLIQYQTYDPTDQGFQGLYERSGKNVREMLARLQKLKPSDFEGLGCKKQCEKFKTLIDKL